MDLDLILGVNQDTQRFIKDLKDKESTIAVVDYNYFDSPYIANNILYLSSSDAKEYIRIFDSVTYFKSLYIYPGMYNQSPSS